MELSKQECKKIKEEFGQIVSESVSILNLLNQENLKKDGYEKLKKQAVKTISVLDQLLIKFFRKEVLEKNIKYIKDKLRTSQRSLQPDHSVTEEGVVLFNILDAVATPYMKIKKILSDSECLADKVGFVGEIDLRALNILEDILKSKENKIKSIDFNNAEFEEVNDLVTNKVYDENCYKFLESLTDENCKLEVLTGIPLSSKLSSNLLISLAGFLEKKGSTLKILECSGLLQPSEIKLFLEIAITAENKDNKLEHIHFRLSDLTDEDIDKIDYAIESANERNSNIEVTYEG